MLAYNIKLIMIIPENIDLKFRVNYAAFERCNAVPMHNIPLWLSECDENCINNRYKYFEMVQIDL